MVSNEYVDQIDRKLFYRIPKAIFAAIAISALTQGGDFLEDAQERLVNEWKILYENRIVLQRPPKWAMK